MNNPSNQTSANTATAALLDTDSGLSATVSQLIVYPVKSCAGVPLKKAMLLETGLEWDRAWMVVDSQGEFLTQRELPRMALVQPQLKTYEMVLRAPGMLALHIALDQVEAPAQVQLWGQKMAAYDMGPIAAQWFTDFLGTPARLVRFDPEHRYVSDMQWTGGIEALNQFNDGYPLLVISEASLDQFNEKRAAQGLPAVGMDRFRPNIVLGNPATGPALLPHDEDRLEQLQIATAQGVVQLQLVKPCPRCPIPNVDPATGLTSPDVGDLLQSYRSDARLDGAVAFGMNAIVLQGLDQVLEVGQMVVTNYRFS